MAETRRKLTPTPLRELADTPLGVPQPPHRRHWRWLLVLVAAIGAGLYWYGARPSTPESPAQTPTAAGPPPVPVVAAAAHIGDIPVYLTGLGTVTAFNTVTVRSRVDGTLVDVAFREGDYVHEGDLLAQIDPRQYQVQLDQAEGQMARDQAQLKAAKANLARFRDLAADGFVATRDVDDQAAQVGLYAGSLQVDQAAIDNAKLLLSYTRVTAPISGRIGLRLVDVGNMVRTGDNNGLVVITQVEPIAVLFTIPEDELRPVLAKLRAGESLVTEAFDRSGRTKLATGELLTADNQIDQATGTTRLKAVFPNTDGALFPNQFINARLLLDTKRDVVIVPEAAVQRGPQGLFVYVVKADQTVEVRQVTLGPTAGGDAAIASGLRAGETVVVDGIDKLRAGSRVEIATPPTEGGAGR